MESNFLARLTFHSTWFVPPRLGHLQMHRLDKTFVIGGFLLGSILIAGKLPAADLLPAERPIADAVDHYIGLKLQSAKIEPAAEATAPNLIRRLTLDLVGRIPTAKEAKRYLDSTDADKRKILVDRLIASDAFTRHQANEFDAFLMTGTNASVRDYLLTAFQSSRGWNDMFRDMLIADQTSESKSATEFVKRRLRDDNPVRGIEKPPDKHRTKTLNPVEYCRLGRAFDQLLKKGANPYAIHAVRMLAVTGCRRNEVFSLKKNAVDEHHHCFRFEDTKGGEQIRPIGAAAFDMLADVPIQEDSDYVFPAAWGQGHIRDVKVLEKACALAKLSGITAHSLRHAFASVAGELSYSEAVIGVMLGHRSNTVTLPWN